tara:strand:+ start:5877 stop:6296 length:420 start_codon:yes stop_codon:yes gene_type:complete
MDLISKIEDLKNFGINLKLDSRELEAFYCRAMVGFFNQKPDCRAIVIDDWEFNVEVEDELISKIIIEDSILRIVPLSEQPYVIVMDVLEFVATLHKPTISLFNRMFEGGEDLASQIIEELSDSEKGLDHEEESFDDEWV